MKTYTLGVRHIGRYWLLAYLLAVPVALAAQLLWGAPLSLGTLMLLGIPLGLYLAVVALLSSIPVAVAVSDDGMVVLRSLLRRWRVPAMALVRVARAESSPQVRGKPVPIAVLALFWQGGRSPLLMAPEDVEPFLADLAAHNPLLRLETPGDDPMALPPYVPDPVEPRSFPLSPVVGRGRLVAYGLVAAWLLPGALGLVVLGGALMVMRGFAGDGVALGLLCISAGILFARLVGGRLWEDLAIPRAISLTPDGVFQVRTLVGALAIPAREVQAVRFHHHRGGRWVSVRHRAGTLRFPADAMPDLPAFTTTLRQLNDQVVLEE